MKRESNLRLLGETLLMGFVLAMLKKLHNDGILLPGLSRGQFYAVLFGVLLGLLGLAGIAHLVGRRRAARKAKALQG